MAVNAIRNEHRAWIGGEYVKQRSGTRGLSGSRRTAIAIGEKRLSEGDHRAALDSFRELASNQQCPPDDGVWGRIAACYRKLGQTRELETLLDELGAIARPHFQVVLQVALARAGDKSFDLALSGLDSALSAYGPDQQANILRIRSCILSIADRHEESLETVASMFDLGTPNADRSARFSLALAEKKQRQAVVSNSSQAEKLQAYWQKRKEFVYIHVCRQLIRIMGHSAEVVADIGSNKTPTLDTFPGNPLKFSVDPGSPYESHDVTSVRQDLLNWVPPKPIQLASCLQVMEHVRDVHSFAERLLKISEVSLISVPHLEEAGSNQGHLHNRIDLERITEWFGRAPNYHYIARELSGDERIVCVFDTTTSAQWETLSYDCPQGLQFRYRWSPSSSSLRLNGIKKQC